MNEIDDALRARLISFRQEMEGELSAILAWWKTYAKATGDGFHGEISIFNDVDTTAARSLVLNARILWTFSEALKFQRTSINRVMADEAYVYLLSTFHDKERGGFFWSVDHNGNVLADHKQLYGQAFALYAFATYYQATGLTDALDHGNKLFRLMQRHGWDDQQGGYWEACTADWKPLLGNRLSEKDLPADKSMNTHLHVLEAYTRLAVCSQDPVVNEALHSLLTIYSDKIVDPATASQFLYFTADWSPLSSSRSFGHDIEASWLLYEAAELSNDNDLRADVIKKSVAMARAAYAALDADGGLMYEYDPLTNHYNREKHWWPQAEGMVGFVHAYEISREEKFLQAALRLWSFIKKSIKHPAGEWVWGIDAEGRLLSAPKAGFWKCPYHNGRACMELITRLNRLLA